MKQNKWLSRKLWMSVLTIIIINVAAYLGRPEMEEQLLQQGSNIVDAVLAIAQLIGSAAVTINYVASEAKIDMVKNK